MTWSNVEECSKGPIGTQLQLDAEKATHLIAKPYPGFIPTIVYNRVSETSSLELCLGEEANGVQCNLFKL